MLFAVQTICPVEKFEAHELTEFGVMITVGIMLLPSTFTTPILFVIDPQEPLGTYEVTFVPLICATSELDGWHDDEP